MEYFLTERLNQDPLERFFGLQRQMGGGSTAPNVERFMTNTQSLRVHQQVAAAPKKGNVEVRNVIDTQDPHFSVPLPKRKKN